MSGEHLDATVANVRLRVAVFRDEATTRRLLERLEKRVREIESQSPRINTQAFAIQAAFEYLTQLEDARAGENELNKDLLRSLDGLATKLQELVEEFRGGT